MKYIIYCRKSTEGEDRQLLSLDAQEHELLEIANKLGLNVVKTYRESMSAKSTGRPIFAKVIKEITSGKANAILCWKLDRLARNFIDGGQVIDLLQKSIIKEIRTYESIHLPNDNVLMLAVQLGMANQYIRDLSVNVKRGNREKLARGEWPGNAPFGYLNDKANKTIILHPTNTSYIKRASYLYIKERKSLGDIANTLYSEGLRTKTGKKVHKSLIQRVLTSRFYTGIMERDGKFYQGKHEPLISKNDFDEAQLIANNNSRPRPKNLSFALTGLLSCENCGCVLTASKKRGHDYYYCTNGKGKCEEHKSYMRENYLYEKVAELLGDVAFTVEQVEVMYRSALERSNNITSYSDKILETLQSELQSLTMREGRLFDIFLNGDIEKVSYDEKLLEIKNKKVELLSEINKRKSEQPIVTLEQIKNVFLQAILRKEEFLNGGIEKKKEVAKTVLWNISFKDKETITVQYKSPYHLLANCPKNADLFTKLGHKDSNLN